MGYESRADKLINEIKGQKQSKEKEAEKLIKVLAACAVVAMVLCGVAGLIVNPGSGNGRRDSKIFTLRSSSGGIVSVATTEEVNDRFTDLAVADDIEGINRLFRAGLLFGVPSGTQVRLIDRGWLASEVKIEGGAQKGRYVFVDNDWLKR